MQSIRSTFVAAVLLALALAGCARHAPPTAAPPTAPAPAEPLSAPPLPPLEIPVVGVHPHQLRDSFHAPRGGGRIHAAIDIHAPRGTPVLAAADGMILRLQQGPLGGNAIYHLDADGVTRYYYAHLDRYARGLAEGQRVVRGEVLGYVGDTGNAAPGDYHLHFSIAILDDVRRWWEGRNLNPYPVLKHGAAFR
jgi:peptidoglycan LD-endopeptidase LytH